MVLLPHLRFAVLDLDKEHQIKEGLTTLQWEHLVLKSDCEWSQLISNISAWLWWLGLIKEVIRVPTLPTPIQDSPVIPSQSNKARRNNKGNTDR
jgi:hypothetical protein